MESKVIVFSEPKHVDMLKFIEENPERFFLITYGNGVWDRYVYAMTIDFSESARQELTRMQKSIVGSKIHVGLSKAAIEGRILYNVRV